MDERSPGMNILIFNMKETAPTICEFYIEILEQETQLSQGYALFEGFIFHQEL
jgi:hypothetical protein